MIMSVFNLSTSETLLCDVLVDLEPEARKKAVRRFIEELGDEKVFSLAQINDVSSVVAHALMDAYGVENVPAHWIKMHEDNSKRISEYLTELDRVAERLAEDDIKLVVLKNGGIACGVYSCRGCCPMGDLDTLVEKRHFRNTHKILLDEGYHFEFRSSLEEAKLEAAEKGGGAEYWKILPEGEKLWFELQWRPVAGRWIRPDQEPDASELMSRSVSISGTDVRILSPEDNLLQVALHTAKHTYVRAPGFRLHLDVVRIVKGQTIDWNIFVKRVLDLQVKTPVFFSLLIPKILFKTPIPDEVIECLKPSQWKVNVITRWLQKVSLFNPDEKKFSRIGYIIFTALLYDDLKGLWRSIFPGREWIMDRYSGKENRSLVGLYLKRLIDLTFRRTNT